MVYAVPGVPHEMQDMSSGPCCPTCGRAGEPAVIASRVLTWGESESGLNERLDDVIAGLDAAATYAGVPRQRHVPVVVELGDDVVEALVEPALALAPRAQHPAERSPPARRCAEQVGQHRPLEHLLHLVRHAGHGVHHLVARRRPGRSGPARCRASAG